MHMHMHAVVYLCGKAETLGNVFLISGRLISVYVAALKVDAIILLLLWSNQMLDFGQYQKLSQLGLVTPPR